MEEVQVNKRGNWKGLQCGIAGLKNPISNQKIWFKVQLETIMQIFFPVVSSKNEDFL